MIYEHKIVETFVPFWKRPPEISLTDASMEQLNNYALDGWEVASAIKEFKFLLRRPIKEKTL